MSDLEVFGHLVITTEIEDAVVNTLQEWMPTYLRRVERQLGFEASAIPNPKSYVVTSDFDRFPEEQLPAIYIICPQIDDPQMDGTRNYRAHYPIDICIYVNAPDRKLTERLSKYYSAALRELILQKGSLGNVVTATGWLGERYGVKVPDTGQRTVGAAEIKLNTEVRKVVRRLTGPSEPLKEPAKEPGPWPIVTKETPVVIDPKSITQTV